MLEVHAHINMDTLPEFDHVGYQWHFFNFTLETLNEVGRRYGLPVPPPLDLLSHGRLTAGPHTQFDNGDPLPASGMTPLDPGGEMVGIQAELAGLQDNEILVVALNSPTDDERTARTRIRKIDAKLERRLGPIGGSSSLGNGYMWAVAIEL